MSATFVIRLDDRREKLNHTYPIKVWVTHKQRSIPYATTFSLSKVDYEKLNWPNVVEKLREIRSGLKELARLLNNYLKDSDEFTFEKFELGFVHHCKILKQRKRSSNFDITVDEKFDLSIYRGKFRILNEAGAAKDNLLGAYTSYVVSLLRLQSVRNADIYQSAYYSLLAFGGNVKLRAITKQYLKEYDVWMRQAGKKKTTIGIYVRTLRKIINNAIDDEILSRKQYPFGRNKYIIPSGRNTKKALNSSCLPAIFNYQPTHKSEWFAKDTWFFLYFGNGMNPKDMACLKYKNIVQECIVFERAKTITTAREDSKSITVYLTKELLSIIERWGNKKVSDETYIFPILTDEMNPLQQMFAIQNFVKNTNDWMAKIFKALGIDSRSSTIVARHSFSTHMKYAGASKELIQESLGHHNIKTTENYLASFEKAVVKEFADKIAAFTNNDPENKLET